MRASMEAELAAWLHRREAAETRAERDLADIRVRALRAGLRLQTAAEMWDGLHKNEKSPVQRTAELGHDLDRKRSLKQDN